VWTSSACEAAITTLPLPVIVTLARSAGSGSSSTRPLPDTSIVSWRTVPSPWRASPHPERQSGHAAHVVRAPDFILVHG